MPRKAKPTPEQTVRITSVPRYRVTYIPAWDTERDPVTVVYGKGQTPMEIIEEINAKGEFIGMEIDENAPATIILNIGGILPKG